MTKIADMTFKVHPMDLEYTATEMIVVALSIALHKHLPDGLAEATDAQMERVAAELVNTLDTCNITRQQAETAPDTLTEEDMDETLANALHVMKIATDDESLKTYGSVLGRKGAEARARSLSPERRSEIARKAALERWRPE